jgi:23S rRNA (cytosine1962-C5)-methyltransferase
MQPFTTRRTVGLMENIPGYQLLDSGEGRKLERFGDKTISRPSSLCEWRRRASSTVWNEADAALAERRSKGEDSNSSGWDFNGKPFSTWQASVQGVTLELELMSNGQLGIFPEHALYLPELKEEIFRLRSLTNGPEPIKILNLFAYTGLATCFSAQSEGVLVTHVDLAKRAIERAKINAERNAIPSNRIRWIVDDALGFMAREARKQIRYDIIIIDPPSFSRVSKSNTWTLEEKVSEIVTLMLGVIHQGRGAIFFTNHSAASTVDIARNITLDHIVSDTLEISTRLLSLQERDTDRRLPAGSLIKITY